MGGSFEGVVLIRVTCASFSCRHRHGPEPVSRGA